MSIFSRLSNNPYTEPNQSSSSYWYIFFKIILINSHIDYVGQSVLNKGSLQIFALCFVEFVNMNMRINIISLLIKKHMSSKDIEKEYVSFKRDEFFSYFLCITLFFLLFDKLSTNHNTWIICMWNSHDMG